MKRFLAAIAFISIMTISSYAQAYMLWSEDFLDVSDWYIVEAQDPGSTITASGGSGHLYVDAANSYTAFAPRKTDANLIPFDFANKSHRYVLNWMLHLETHSTSWSIALDEFNSAKEYISTSWGIYPDSGTTNQSIGMVWYPLRYKTFNPSTAYVIPKVNVYTGNGGQTISLDSMSMEVIEVVPEPASLLLLGSGLVGLICFGKQLKQFKKAGR